MPSLSELLGGAALIAALFGGVEYIHVQALKNTITNMQIAAATAAVEQASKDAVLNAQIQKASQDKVNAIRAAVAAALQKVSSDAPTNTCGPSVRDAVRSLQHSNPGSGAASPGR